MNKDGNLSGWQRANKETTICDPFNWFYKLRQTFCSSVKSILFNRTAWWGHTATSGTDCALAQTLDQPLSPGKSFYPLTALLFPGEDIRPWSNLNLSSTAFICKQMALHLLTAMTISLRINIASIWDESSPSVVWALRQPLSVMIKIHRTLFSLAFFRPEATAHALLWSTSKQQHSHHNTHKQKLMSAN